MDSELIKSVESAFDYLIESEPTIVSYSNQSIAMEIMSMIDPDGVNSYNALLPYVAIAKKKHALKIRNRYIIPSNIIYGNSTNAVFNLHSSLFTTQDAQITVGTNRPGRR